jgi:hypothetical protein
MWDRSVLRGLKLACLLLASRRVFGGSLSKGFFEYLGMRRYLGRFHWCTQLPFDFYL